MKAALGDGVKAAFAKIEKTAESVGTMVNGWQIGAAAGSREFYQGNWALRAAAAKLGIYGNSEAEAVYPFTRHDVNGIVLDGSKHTYQMTFPAGQLPPVNAFWSITMYDGRTQLLIDNPINRYLINSPMLPELKKNPDGSLTVYIQKDSPGKDRESNWLPAPDGPMFVVMRLYWPKTEPPSVLSARARGPGSRPPWCRCSNLNAQDVKRFGDKSLENFIRTDTRYGHDGLFQGPRGWGYWNYLEYPRPIQNPNLWPDMQSTYFIGRLALPAGAQPDAELHLSARPLLPVRALQGRARHLRLDRRGAGGAADSSPTRARPTRSGSAPTGSPSSATSRCASWPRTRRRNARRSAREHALRRQGRRRADVRQPHLSLRPGQRRRRLGPGRHARRGSGSADLRRHARRRHQAVGGGSGQTVRPAHAGAQAARHRRAVGDAGAREGQRPHARPGDRARAQGPRVGEVLEHPVLDPRLVQDAGGARRRSPMPAPSTAAGTRRRKYMFVQLSRKFGPVYVMRGKMPTFPNTYAGASGRGLEVMPAAQTQYWSLVSCEAMPSGQIVDALTDMQVPLDKDGNYTIVYSRKEDRPANATPRTAWRGSSGARAARASTGRRTAPTSAC